MIERFSFAGLNANESACVILYMVTALWVFAHIAKSHAAKISLIIMEACLLLLVAKTMSRGGVVALACNSVYFWLIYRRSMRRKSLPESGPKCRVSLASVAGGRTPITSFPAFFQVLPLEKTLNWVTYSPIWRVILVFCHPGLWSRSTPGYLMQDNSIGNRFELWKGALKMIVGSPLFGWGYRNTGASYMNWFQNTGKFIYYRGLVNSYLQIGCAWGLPVLSAVLLLLVWSLANTKFHPSSAKNGSVDILCFLIISTWMLCSLFSSMLGSLLLLAMPLAAIILAVLRHPPKFKTLGYSWAVSMAICLLLFFAGRHLAKTDPLAIKTDRSDIVFISNEQADSNDLCVLCVDENAVGAYYGKEIRKFLSTAHYDKCLVFRRIEQLPKLAAVASSANLIILSGETVSRLKIQNARAKYVLLLPSAVPDFIPPESIQSIVCPEIDMLHYLGLPLDNPSLCAKIHIIPFDACFETSWSKYIHF